MSASGSLCTHVPPSSQLMTMTFVMRNVSLAQLWVMALVKSPHLPTYTCRCFQSHQPSIFAHYAMSAINQVPKPSNKKPSKQNIRPCDPSQLVDVHLPPAVPLQTFSQKLLAACSALYSHKSRESDSPSPTLPPVRPVRVLEPRPVSPYDGNEVGAEVESLGAAQAEHEHEHRIPDTLYDQEKFTDSKSKLEVGAGELDEPKGKTEAEERRETEEWDRTVWERWFAEQERRRTVEREGERYTPRMRKGRQLPTIREHIEVGPDGDVDEGDDTYADVDSIDILEALSHHPQSRPSSSHGLLTDALSSTDAKTSGSQPGKGELHVFPPVPTHLQDSLSSRPERLPSTSFPQRRSYHNSLPPDHPKEWHHCHLCRLKSERACKDPTHKTSCDYVPRQREV